MAQVVVKLRGKLRGTAPYPSSGAAPLVGQKVEVTVQGVVTAVAAYEHSLRLDLYVDDIVDVRPK
jgi:hypothetical protein